MFECLVPFWCVHIMRPSGLPTQYTPNHYAVQVSILYLNLCSALVL